MQKVVQSIPEQINIALDGRTQRWLSFEIRMPETDLSKKMNEKIDFTDEEIKQINDLLKSNIKK